MPFLKLNKINCFKALSLSTLAAISVLSAGCENEDERQVFAAQDCLDNARDADQADVCVAKVESLTSPESYLIRCSAHFIAQGFTGSRAADAFQGLKNNTGSGTDPMAVAMAYLVFAKDLPSHTADLALSDCKASGVNSMVQLATMSKLATFVADPSGSGISGGLFDPSSSNFDVSQISTAISNLVSENDATKNETIGNLATTANQTYCAEGSPQKNTEICTNLEASIAAGNGDAATIGRSLLEQLQTNSGQ